MPTQGAAVDGDTLPEVIDRLPVSTSTAVFHAQLPYTSGVELAAPRGQAAHLEAMNEPISDTCPASEAQRPCLAADPKRDPTGGSERDAAVPCVVLDRSRWLH